MIWHLQHRLRFTLLSAAVALLSTACVGDLQEDSPPSTLSTVQTASRVSSPGDNAEERASGLVTHSSPDLELAHDLEHGQQLVGLRFQKVEVPRGATIESAYIQFQADETDSGQLRVRVWAQDADDAAGFSAGHTWDISKRARTSASALWSPGNWEARGEQGSAQRTPDLSEVLGEVTRREGWAHGNSVTFVVADSSGRSWWDNRKSRRVAESYQGDKEGAPVLHIEYSGGEPIPEPAPPAPPAPAPPEPTPPEPEPAPSPRVGVPVIFDTDMGTDADDVGALAVLHALADRQEADILATVSSVHDPYSAAAIDAINTYYGRPDLPIGRNADPEQLPVVTPWWREHKPRFVRDLAERFPGDLELESVPPAAAVYREVLAAQPDGSVTVVTVGFMSNLAALLTSEPDEHSPLSGEDLVKRKVQKLVVMGGTYPSSSRDLNLRGSKGKIPATEAIRVLEGWPTKITFAPGKVCGNIITGRTLAETPESNPVREAYRLFFGREGVGRESWDLCTVLYAVRGLTGPEDAQYFTKPEGNERLTMSQSGRSAWVSPGDGLHERLRRELPKRRMETLLESLLVTPPER